MCTGGSFPGVKRQGREADHSPPGSAEEKKSGSMHLLPHTPSWRSGSLLRHRDIFTFYWALEGFRYCWNEAAVSVGQLSRRRRFTTVSRDGVDKKSCIGSDCVRNEASRRQRKMNSVQNKVKDRKQNWIDHLDRMTDEITLKQVLQYKPKGCRDLGRPCERWNEYETSKQAWLAVPSNEEE
jgi:hypothetical protein